MKPKRLLFPAFALAATAVLRPLPAGRAPARASLRGALTALAALPALVALAALAALTALVALPFLAELPLRVVPGLPAGLTPLLCPLRLPQAGAAAVLAVALVALTGRLPCALPLPFDRAPGREPLVAPLLPWAPLRGALLLLAVPDAQRAPEAGRALDALRVPAGRTLPGRAVRVLAERGPAGRDPPGRALDERALDGPCAGFRSRVWDAE